MVKYASKPNAVDPYTIPNKGPIPKIEPEEGLPPGALDIAWVSQSRRNLYHWSNGLKWYERLHAHATMNSARRHVKCKRPFEPKDDLDFVLGAAFCPMLQTFAEKTDPYLQAETAFGENMNLDIKKKQTMGLDTTGMVATWRLLRNRFVIIPDQSDPTGYPIVYSNGGTHRRENIYNVKLGIAADHTPQTNPGYSRTPSGAFYSI